jgi:negative regulator of sigma E activity
MIEISDDMLMAYADGELSEAEALAVEAALDEDSALQNKLARHTALKSAIAQSFDEVTDAPLPAGLLATIEADKAANTAQHGQTPAPDQAGLFTHLFSAVSNLMPKPAWQPAMIAATVALVASVALLQNTDQAISGMPQTLVAALDTLQDRSAVSGIEIQESYLKNTGEFCRSFSDRQTLQQKGVACRDTQGAWTMIAVADLPPEGAFLPAGPNEKIMAALTDMQALPKGAEAAYLKSK